MQQTFSKPTTLSTDEVGGFFAEFYGVAWEMGGVHNLAESLNRHFGFDA
jgi:hypothetical protein